MYRPKDTQERILHRLKISLGQLRRVLTMVAADEYCIDILHQSQAVQKALKEVDALILDNHLRSCVAQAIKKGKDKEVIDEVMKAWTKS